MKETYDDRQNYVLTRISSLKSLNSVRKSKYERNLRLYEATLNISLDSIKDAQTVGFWKGGTRYDTTPDIQLNLIKSCIDTLSSKIASTKVRPFFNTVGNTTFHDIFLAQQAQMYFDQLFDYQHVAKIVSDTFRLAAIFDKGYVYIDPVNNKIQSALPWQVFFAPAEVTYGEPTEVYYERKQYPTSLLPIKTSSNSDYVSYGVYYNTKQHIRADILESGEVYIYPYEAEVVPFCSLSYCNPIIGNSAQSIVDMLLGLQLEVDVLANKIKDASQLNPANTIFIPKSSGIESKKFTNGIGNVVLYDMPPNASSSPITIATPSIIDPQYMKILEEFKQTAYEMVGISQLSATSQKPQGLDSGIALQTMENIESDRFETQLDSVINLYKDIAKTAMLVFDKNKDVINSDYDTSIKFGDLADSVHKMKIQFSGADKLSKDPSTKLQQLQVMAQSGILPAATIGKFLDMPDLEMGYNVANNTWNAVQQVLRRCVEENIYEVPPFVPYALLQQEIINTQLLLFASGPDKNVEAINRLTNLFNVIYEASNKMAEFSLQLQDEVSQSAMDQADMETQQYLEEEVIQ